MFAYSPQNFVSLYASELAQRLWAFHTRLENVVRSADDFQVRRARCVFTRFFPW